MKRSRVIPIAIGGLASLAVMATPIAISAPARAAVINVYDQAKRYQGTREYSLPALTVTDWCLTRGGFDRNFNEQTWIYRVTASNDTQKTAALHLNDRSMNLDTSATRWRVIVLRPGKSQTFTVSPMSRIYEPQLSDSLERDVNFSGALVRATKGQIKKLRSGARAKGLLHLDENSARPLPATFTGSQLCPGQELSSTSGQDGNESISREGIYPFTGTEIMSDQLPSEAYLSKFPGYLETRSSFVRAWRAHAVRGWDDAAAGKALSVNDFDMTAFLPTGPLTAADTAYLIGYTQSLGYFDYRSGHESRTERLADAPSSVRTIEWTFEYSQGWELAKHYQRFPYKAAQGD